MFTHLNSATTSVFGEDATIVRPNGRDVDVRGIFDSRHYETEGEEGVGVSELITTLAIDLSDTGEVSGDDMIRVRGVLYRITDRRPDGQGMMILQLAEDA